MDPSEFKKQGDLAFAELRGKIMEAFKQEFMSKPDLNVGGQPQLFFQVAYVAALLDVAAVIAVDSGMTSAMFKGIADESHQGAYDKAPKFG